MPNESTSAFRRFQILLKEVFQMKTTHGLAVTITTVTLLFGLTGCVVIGAGVGAVAGAGTSVGVAGGAVIGGVVGYGISK